MKQRMDIIFDRVLKTYRTILDSGPDRVIGSILDMGEIHEEYDFLNSFGSVKMKCPYGHRFGIDYDEYEDCNCSGCSDDTYRACQFESGVWDGLIGHAFGE